MTIERVRIQGHKLMGEGAAYDGYRTLMQPFSRSTAGRGRAWCECGELSDVLETAADRKRWHRDHKAAVGASLKKERQP